MDVAVYFSLVFTVNIYSIIDFYKEKAVSNVLIMNCNIWGSIVWHKIFNDNNMRAARFDLKNGYLYDVPYTYSKMGILLDTSCENWTQAFEIFPDDSIFKNPYVWLIFSDNMLSTTNILSNHSIQIDSDVTILRKVNNTFNFYEVFHKYYFYDTLSIRHIGYWNKKLHLTNMRKRDLSGLTMKCYIVVTDKIVNQTFETYLRQAKKDKGDGLHKLKFYSVLQYFRDMFNLSYDIHRINSWGYLRDGKFDGVVGTLQRSDADIGGSPVFYRSDRAEVVDYVAETWQSRQCFILRHPKHPGGFYTIYTRPLTAKVWYCILCILVLSAVILRMMFTVKVTVPGDGPADSSFSLALLFVWSAICQQGMSVDRSLTAAKMVVFVTFVYALTLYQYYNATVVSTLLREPPKNIKNLEDLVKSNLKAGAEDVLYTKDFFKRTTDQLALKMYRKKIVPDGQYNFHPPEYGMALVKQGGYAFHVDVLVGYRIMKSTFTEREICEAHEIPLYPPQKMGFVIRKGSPYKEHFARALRKIYEAGLMYRLRSVWDEPKPVCVHTPDSSIFSVSIREFSTALLALAAGMIASLLVLIGEIAAQRILKRRIAFRH